jgi:type I restriction enzyme R subunit
MCTCRCRLHDRGFDGYDKEDVEGLIKNRYDEAKSELEGTLTSLEALIENCSYATG